MDVTRFIVFIFVFLIINVPIYTQLYNLFLKDRKSWEIVTITALYWIGTVFTENLFPFLTVIFLISKFHIPIGEKNYLRDINIWRYKWSTIINVSFATLVFKTILTLGNAIYVFILNYFMKFDVKPQEVVTDFYESGFYARLALFFLIVIFAPFVEEYVFRYFLYDKLFLPRMPATFAAILSAIIFTLAHYNASGIPSFFGLALFCNYMYEKKGYFAAVAAHMTFNLSTVVLLLFMKV